MKRRELEKALLVLETTPLLLARVEEISPNQAMQLRLGGLSLRDRIWSLALMEKDVWNLRIRRLLAEDEPRLEPAEDAEFFARAARIEGDHREGLRAFGVFRGQNVRLLRQVSGRTWDRAGRIDPDGRIALRDVPSAMARMDERSQSKLRSLPLAAETRHPAGSTLLVDCCI